MKKKEEVYTLTRSQLIRLFKSCIKAGGYGMSYKDILKSWDSIK
jgi:hypothetical protein